MRIPLLFLCGNDSSDNQTRRRSPRHPSHQYAVEVAVGDSEPAPPLPESSDSKRVLSGPSSEPVPAASAAAAAPAATAATVPAAAAVPRMRPAESTPGARPDAPQLPLAPAPPNSPPLPCTDS